MSAATMAVVSRADNAFRHEALFYAGDDDFVLGAATFLRESGSAGEPALVVVSSRKIDLLREHLNDDAATVEYADMEDVGTNPARIIPAWTEFVTQHEGRRLRGISEPIWAERSAAELAECQRHEALLNIAFAGSTGFSLLCPYDVTTLGHDVIEEARHNHPFLRRDDVQWASAEYPGTEELAAPFADPLPEPPSSIDLAFEVAMLSQLRSIVQREAINAGLGSGRAADAVAAVNEVASNSVRHGGGRGVLRTWLTDEVLLFEVRDDGHIVEPLVGRTRPIVDTSGGRGLWMANQLCELVQVRSFSTGTVVRMHFCRPPRR